MSRLLFPRSTRTLLLCLPLLCVSLLLTPFSPHAMAAEDSAREIRLGIIGLDTSHAIAFAELLNAANPPAELANCRIVAAFPEGSPDIASSVERVPAYKEKIQTLGVKIVDSIPELLSQVDGVLLETNDGRPHLAQLRPVLAAGKPVFIDKPIAGSLADAVAIVREAERAGVPFFSCSSLRYLQSAQQIRGGSLGRVFACDAHSPCALEPTHPDLFWYGIHGVETLFTVMGPGCERVVRMSSPGADVVVGQWKDGRIGTFRGQRDGQAGYGGIVFAEKGTQTLGNFEGYRPLVVEIVKFFRTGKPPIDPRETLEIYAFMEAADESKRQGGKPVTLDEVLRRAETTP